MVEVISWAVDNFMNRFGRRMINLVFRKLQQPPPWRWGCEGSFFERIGSTSLLLLPLELLQQLHWWVVVPIRRGFKQAALGEDIPWQLQWKACWLNSYRPHELVWWWVAGVRSWTELSKHSSESLTVYRHNAHRHLWPSRCKPAQLLLSNKAALLEQVPEQWRAPFLGLSDDHSKAVPVSSWWKAALLGHGVVLKPLRGHAGRGVVRFRWFGSTLQQEALFGRLPKHAPHFTDSQAPDPRQLLAHWHRVYHSQEPAVATPYVCHSSELPTTEPSVVVRVVTSQPSPGAEVFVRQAWLEVPLDGDAMAFISPEGYCLPNPGKPFTTDQQNSLDQWQQLLIKGMPICVRACLDASMLMHACLPPIDQVAWDWVPASPQPVLLEGNGCFGLLIPQLFADRRLEQQCLD